MLTLSAFKLWLSKFSHFIGSFLIYSLWEYWLGKTKKIAANSTVELIVWLFKRCLRKGKT